MECARLGIGFYVDTEIAIAEFTSSNTSTNPMILKMRDAFRRVWNLNAANRARDVGFEEIMENVEVSMEGRGPRMPNAVLYNVLAFFPHVGEWVVEPMPQ